MTAGDALREGDLTGALAQLQDEVRSAPQDPRHRVFLFQLLSVLGQWDRALAQLEVVRSLDEGAIAMVRTYEAVLRCELLRQQVFAGQRSPLVLGNPEPWIAELIEALRISGEGNEVAAQKLREHAFEVAPTTAGTLSIADANNPQGTSDCTFEWLADADSRLGPVLEAVINGRYYWVPVDRIKRVDIEAPEDLRDVVWMPAHFLWANEGDAVGLIPTRYPGTESADDSALQLARRTEWREPLEGVYEGIGQRMLATDAGEFAIMNVRTITCNSSAG
jgi:type VI secretion system protein ImpE